MKLDRIIAVRTGKTVYRDGDRVIKVFDSDYSKADILNEALNQARIEETGLAHSEGSRGYDYRRQMGYHYRIYRRQDHGRIDEGKSR